MKYLLTLVLLIGFYQPAYAQSWFDKLFGPKTHALEKKVDKPKHDNQRFSDRDRELITDYYKGKKQETSKKNKGKNKQLPPGLAKKESLPPGLAKQLEKNGTLPPGLAKRDLPHDLDRHLSPLEKGYKRVIVDDDILLIEETTGLILDILRGVGVINRY